MKETDYELIQRCLGGDRNGFKGIVERYQRRVFDTVYRMVFDTENARDITQEVFVKAYTKLHTFNPVYPFRVWIQRIATRTAIDHLRRRKPEMLEWNGDGESARWSVEARYASPQLRPDQRLEQVETAEIVRKAVEHLQPKLKAVIVLRHFREMSYEEIADTLQIPIGTVKNRLFRARDQLQQYLVESLDAIGERVL